MQDYNSKVYETHDLALASALVTYGFQIAKIERWHGNKAIFIFDDTTELGETVQAYWNDKLRVSPKAYFDAMKHVKTRLYSEM